MTGATGGIGGRVAARLAELDLPQRLIVRDPARAPRLPRAELAEVGGYEDAAGIRGALEGVSVLLLVSAHEAPDRVEQHRTAVDAAVSEGSRAARLPVVPGRRARRDVHLRP